MRDRLAQHVRVDDSPARIDRLWGGVSARLASPRHLLRWASAGAAVCALAGAALFLGRGPFRTAPNPAPWDGTRLETAIEARSVTLGDGSQVTLDPRSALEVAEKTPAAIELRLGRGRLLCDVTHRPGRSFRVVAAGVEVRVVGTRFSVTNARDGESARIAVQVERGVVEVRAAGGSGEVTRVEAGHGWSQVIGAEASRTVRAAAPETTLTPTPTPTAIAVETAPATVRTPPVVRSRPAAPRAAGARDLFEQGRRAWHAGRIEEAAQIYQDLLSRFPRDARAGLAAFELGRLRMDRLSDLPGAVAALERAVALAPGSELREDAMARLVAAHAAADDRPACARARDQYLRAYPAGVHRRTVAAACGTP